MSGSQSGQTSPPESGGEGIRVIAKPGRSGLVILAYLLLAAILIAAGLMALWPSPSPPPARSQTPAAGGETLPASLAKTPLATSPGRTAISGRPARPSAPREPEEEPYETRSVDPDDLAAHIRPGDPEPTVAELIDALHSVGIHSGIAAFNPPGTSPPLAGLAVPEDFDLPEGFVRHHQVTDEGEPIEPILMFSPDFEFFDAAGQPVAIPEDRVVPAELAPPGLPIRQVEIPPRP